MPRKISKRGDTYFDSTNGYVIECVKGHPIDFGRNWVAQHIVLMCEKLGRRLKKGEMVHHKNHNKRDNRLRNLELMDRRRHAAAHRGQKRSEEVKRRMSEAAKTRCSPYWRAQVSARVKKQHEDGKFGRQTWKEK